MAALTVNLPASGPVIDLLSEIARREGIDVPNSGAAQIAALTTWLRGHLRQLYIAQARATRFEGLSAALETQLHAEADAIT